MAADLGFQDITHNSMDGVADRDFIAEFLFWGTLTMVHLSRLAEDLIIYSSREFGFVTLADAYSTGSSIMPQKKNPDALELLRGKSGRVMGSMTGLMATLKGLPTTYNKDLQEDKEPLFDAIHSVSSSLQIACGVISTMTPNQAALRAALSTELLATDLAEYLVRKGVPFRETHHVAGAAVRMAEVQAVPLSELTLEDLLTLHHAFEADVMQVWNFEQSVEQRDAAGGTSRRAVLEQIGKLRDWLGA
jgi:argininosuccinate lyase